MSNGHAEILVGIDRGVVDADFVMKVGTSGASTGANVADRVATMNLLSGCDCEAGKVAVACGDAVAMIYHDRLAVSAQEVREGDHAIGGRDHRLAVGAANIHATVKCAFSVERVNALSEAGRDLAFNRPKVGCGVGTEPVGGGGIASEAEADADRGRAG